MESNPTAVASAGKVVTINCTGCRNQFDNRLKSVELAISTDDLLITANKLVHFGWKNEAIPISSPKKSLIARFFDAIFG